MIERRVVAWLLRWTSCLGLCPCLLRSSCSLGGGPRHEIGAFVGAGLGHWLRRKLFAHHLNQFFVTFLYALPSRP